MMRSVRPTLPIVLLALASCGGVPDGGAGGSGDGGHQPYFATAPRGNAVMQALFRGPLLVRDDCILIDEADHASLPIWPEGFTVGRDDAGRVVIRDDAGAAVAREGAAFEMGGGYVAEF